jgi:hypothetical protein
MFRSTTIIRELVLSLAKVTLEHLCPYRLCGGVAACLGSAVCVVCCVPKHFPFIFVVGRAQKIHFMLSHLPRIIPVDCID